MRIRGWWFWVGAGAVAVAVAAVIWAPGLIPATDGIEKNAAAHSQEVGRNRTAVLAVLGGLLAVWGAAYTARTYHLSQRGQITERFFRAVERLDSTNTAAVRLAAVYELQAIVSESPGERFAVLNVLNDLLEQEDERARQESSALVQAERVVATLQPPAIAPRDPEAAAARRARLSQAIMRPAPLVVAGIFVATSDLSLRMALLVIAAGLVLTVEPNLLQKTLGEESSSSRGRPDIGEQPLIVRREVPDADVARALEDFAEAWEPHAERLERHDSKPLWEAAEELLAIRNRVAHGVVDESDSAAS